MGADLLISWLWTTQPDKIDFEKARAVIRTELAAMPEVPTDEFWKRWDPNDDFGSFGDLEGADIQKQLLADTDEIASLWNLEQGYRDCFRSTIGPVEVLMSGGMSWGDSPTEMFDTINRWGSTPAAQEAGFFR